MDTAPTSQPGSPTEKITTPSTPGVSSTSETEHPTRRRRRCPPRASSGGEAPNSASGRMSVANSENVDEAEMECSDGEAVDTEDTDEVNRSLFMLGAMK